MKFTNVKQLIIKFMGGGLINFPTRFLRWVKINGDVEGDDGGGDSGGGGSSSDVFFSPLAIQPTHIAVQTDDETYSIIEIKDLTASVDNDFGGRLIYSKDALISIGINENDLNNLEIVSIDEIEEDRDGQKALGGNYINTILDENYVIAYFNGSYEGCNIVRIIAEDGLKPVIYRVGDNLYTFNMIQEPM